MEAPSTNHPIDELAAMFQESIRRGRQLMVQVRGQHGQAQTGRLNEVRRSNQFYHLQLVECRERDRSDAPERDCGPLTVEGNLETGQIFQVDAGFVIVPYDADATGSGEDDRTIFIYRAGQVPPTTAPQAAEM